VHQWNAHDYCQFTGHSIKVQIRVLPSHTVDLYYWISLTQRCYSFVIKTMAADLYLLRLVLLRVKVH